MTQGNKILDGLSAAVVATLISAPLTMITASTLNLNISLPLVFAFALYVSLSLSAALHSKPGLILSAALAAVAVVAAVRGGNPYFSEFRLFIGGLFQDTGELNFTGIGTFLTYTIALVFTGILYWMTRIGGGFYPALAISLIVLLGGWFVEHTLNPVYIIPVIAGLVCQFARTADERLPYFKILPIALLISALAFAVVPKDETTWPPLEEGAEKVRQLFYDYFMFTDPRMAYSLNMDGYLPMGDRLGGPAEPRNEDVMEVTAGRELLLRGSIKRTYTGYSWSDNTVNSRYLFGDFTKRGTREGIFDAGRASAIGAASAFPIANADVRMLSTGTSTLFVPHRLSDLSTAFDLPSYFNTSGEVFTTRGLLPGDAYSLTAEIPVSDSARMAEAVARAARENDPSFASVAANYTTLPRTVEPEVYALTQTVAEGAQTPFEVALRIQSHLLNNYEYTLNVPYPPDRRDFVSNFLLSEKKGYCTYFASAMAVMGRAAGLPTRYVEGYAIPKGNGAQTITGQNAHAWVEIYFRGIGWLSFNPTPGYGDMNGERESGGGGSPNETENPPDDGSEDPANNALPTEPPEDEPEDPSDEPDAQDEPTSEPTDEPPSEPTDEPDAPPPPDDEDSEQSPPQSRAALIAWLAIALILLAAGIQAFIRLRRSDPAYRAAQFKAASDKLIVWYRAILLLYEQLGQAPDATESPRMFSQRMKAQDMAIDAFEYVSDRLTVSRYARNIRVEGATFRQAKAVYADLARQLKFREKLRWYRIRILKGLGDLSHLP
jgi:hypothetical protein